ncbi:peptide chain release factor 2 [Sedimentibacter sp. zth1]|uniref:peptide chain release factor 2 n=1 Tax=Sedimentibacter sp. zth1 TaxID=2816908 RepID=UPI001A92E222|nr:peptide chain release factor 2 [Sedimentibacter sp. zth1]QSX06980.1 peptide chain release factor 2 [Sedimentibacter sp. zth1]
MIDLYEFTEKLKKFKIILEEVGVSLDIPKLKEDNADFENFMQSPEFWNDTAKAQQISQNLKYNSDTLKQYEDMVSQVEDFELLLDLVKEEDDESQVQELNKEMKSIDKLLEAMKLKTLLNGEYDHNNAILSIHSGAGGTEAQDWAEMLLRMYNRWAESHGYKISMLDILKDTEAGIKSVTILITGDNVYGYLKGEKGVHRLVRISPFDSNNRRHTSFASVDVMPEIADTDKIDINESDLRIDTFRSSGAGGQSVNTTDSAVRITHIPTGVVVSCQNERSQHKNKEFAMKMLQAKLIEIKETEHKEKIEDIQGKYNQIAWGSQIRSYVFHPYSLVKDHRTNTEIANTQSVMDGNLDVFINEYLKYKSICK